VQPVHYVGARSAELVTPVDQQPQRDPGVVGLHPPQAGGAHRDHGNAARVDRVGLAALAGGEDPGPGGQFRGQSTTVSPSATRRCATCRPIPLRIGVRLG
jgi:hypothetical protein